MKKIFSVVMMATLMCLFLFSCKETNELEAEYADYTVEENKQNIEDEGIEVLGKMDAMKDLSFVYAIQDIYSLLDLSEDQSDVYGDVAALIKPLVKADEQLMGVASLRSTNIAFDSLSNLFEYYGGVYTYNFDENTFVRVPSTTEITFNFPIGNSTTNNGILTLDNYTYQYATNEDFEGTELPKSLDLNLYDGSTNLLKFEMNVSYNSDNLPSTETTELTFKEGYSFVQTLNYVQTDVSWDFSFAYNTYAFFKGGFDLNGTFAYDSLANLDYYNDATPLLNVANAYIQAGNLKAVGQLNYKSLIDGMEAFNEGDHAYTKATYDSLCTIYNNGIKAVILYADSKEAIAKLSFYTTEETDQYVDETDTYFEMNVNFVFSDGSALDGSFFDEGFDELETAFNAFIEDMEENYGFSFEDEAE